MRTLGIVLTVFGGLMILSGINVALTKYDLGSSHDLSKFLGALGVSLVITAVGIALVVKSKRRSP